MKNSLRSAMHAGAVTIGTWLQFGHAGVAELMAQAGFDWIAIDLEHSVIGLETLQSLIQVIELTGCVPLVRLSANDAVLAKRVMDAGAHGVIVPAVNSPDEAEHAVRAVKYPPAGSRGMGLGRAHAYGARFREYVEEVAAYAVVVVMIEHRQGVEQAEQILRVPGIDGVFIGPYDLSASYGALGQLDHPLVREAMARVVRAAQQARVSPGIHVVHPPVEQVKARIAEGFRFIAYGGDMLFLLPAIRSAAASVRDLAGLGRASDEDAAR